TSPETDNMCHLGGFITGLLLGLPMGAFSRKSQLLQVATVFATLAVLFAAGREMVQNHGAEGQLYRASLAHRQRNYALAADILEKYTQSKPNDENGWLMLGYEYLRLEQPDKAISAYQQALKVNPNSADAKQALSELQGGSH